MSKLSEQQRQTLSFFRGFADEWHQRAKGEALKTVNIITQRNACFIRTAAGADYESRWGIEAL